MSSGVASHTSGVGVGAGDDVALFTVVLIWLEYKLNATGAVPINAIAATAIPATMGWNFIIIEGVY